MAKKRKPEHIERHSIRTRMAEMSELPKDVIMGVPMLTMSGQTELTLENHHGIIEYTEVLVRVRIKNGQVKIKGRNLNVSYYMNDDMKITGYIDTIEYQH